MNRRGPASRISACQAPVSTRRLAVLVALVPVLLGCAAPTAPDKVLPINAVLFTAPPQYTVWAAELLTCVGEDAAHAGGLVASVRWYQADGFSDDRDGIRVWIEGNPAPFIGAEYEPDDEAIYLRVDFVDTAWVVKHELNHVRIRDAAHVDPSWHACAQRGAGSLG